MVWFFILEKRTAMAPIAIEKDAQETVELPISVKQPDTQPKIKRQIDIEGGSTTAKVW